MCPENPLNAHAGFLFKPAGTSFKPVRNLTSTDTFSKMWCPTSTLQISSECQKGSPRSQPSLNAPALLQSAKLSSVPFLTFSFLWTLVVRSRHSCPLHCGPCHCQKRTVKPSPCEGKSGEMGNDLTCFTLQMFISLERVKMLKRGRSYMFHWERHVTLLGCGWTISTSFIGT